MYIISANHFFGKESLGLKRVLHCIVWLDAGCHNIVWAEYVFHCTLSVCFYASIMLNFLIEDFDVFNEHPNGDIFVTFLVLFFKAQSFSCQRSVLERHCIN